MKLATQIMEITHAYRLWQAPLRRRNLRPSWPTMTCARRGGCWTWAAGRARTHRTFPTRTIWASITTCAISSMPGRRHGRDFLVADITRPVLAPAARFDFILINSFLHHVDTPSARGLLSQLSALLTEDGHVHILDLVLPARPSVARLLARLDRGEFPRPLEDWEANLQ